MVIKDGAIFIADSHYNSKQTILFKLLEQIKSNQIKPSQIYLMGDIFDFLCQEIIYFKNLNFKIIELINSLSKDIEIIYFEGNHDFNLKNIFPNILTIPREQQPVKFIQNKQTIALSHGDIFTPTGYNVFSTIFRSHLFLSFLNFIDINSFLSKRSEKKLKEKKICSKQKDFNIFIEKRIKNYNVDLIIEGHFHQGHLSSKYINIPSLCCDNNYMVYEEKVFKFKKV